MDSQPTAMESEIQYPVLLIPKECLSFVRLSTGSDITENVFLDVNITSADPEGNNMCIYSGICNVKVADGAIQPEQNYTIDYSTPVVIADPGFDLNQSNVWIDPGRSSVVYNHYEEPQEHYTVQRHTKTSRITYEKRSLCSRKKVYNFEESIRYSKVEEYEHKKFKTNYGNEQSCQNVLDANLNLDDDKLECGVFLSQLSEEILNKEENKAREELKFVKSHNNALNQLMSPSIKSLSKQSKTILFVGQDLQCGQTVQNIAMNNPSVDCSTDNFDVIYEDFRNNPHHKKYQCNNCSQIFDKLAAFKHHIHLNDMASHSRQPSSSFFSEYPNIESEVDFICTQCGKNLKTREAFERHCKGHGNPEVECNLCHKVFASKFTLKKHREIHAREHPCRYCVRSFSRQDDLRHHIAKAHLKFSCEKCDFYFDTLEGYESHMLAHTNDTSERFAGSYAEDLSDEDLIIPWTAPLGDIEEIAIVEVDDKSQVEMLEDDAGDVIAKVLANEMFRLKTNKAGPRRAIHKACEVCHKKFDRVGDLKRHLIEHVIRSTLKKSPVNQHGTLNITCEVCKAVTFNKIDKYKAHLREHAQLTIYKCTFCDKSFSDSSNFSKHKKIHGVGYMQCDLCKRKFNSKKMISQHMEYHNQNPPVPCEYCDKVFHFESMLNKHIKAAHGKDVIARARCRFCLDIFSCLKQKWDHEWKVHNMRKMIVDCLVCGSKFRKYLDMKRHCMKMHDIEIPSAKNLLSKR